MLEYVQQHLAAMEQDSRLDARDRAFQALRALGLSEFGEVLWSMPSKAYPRLSKLLPRMAAREVQESWTGSSGLARLKETIEFARALSHHYAHLTGKSLAGTRILDYGCGYGRIARLMYFFTDEANVFGCDPWQKSIQICRDDGLGENFRRSEYLPESLPLDDKKFDLIFAFSVFTHLSERATHAALSALRKYVADDGVLAITIRPIEFWQFVSKRVGAGPAAELEADHRDEGFAFLPHRNRQAIDNNDSYGDTSMTLDWLTANVSEWQVVAIDRSVTAPYQIYVFLRPGQVG